MANHPLTRQGRQAMQAVIQEATKAPGGYLWWHSLPDKGKHSQATLTRNWTALMLTKLFPQPLLDAILQACLTIEGLPCQRSKPLYIWMLNNVYKGKYREMYKDWLNLNKQS